MAGCYVLPDGPAAVLHLIFETGDQDVLVVHPEQPDIEDGQQYVLSTCRHHAGRASRVACSNVEERTHSTCDWGSSRRILSRGHKSKGLVMIMWRLAVVRQSRYGLLVIILSILTLAAHAAHKPEIETANDHRFLSAPDVINGFDRVTYQVCNTGKTASAFKWSAAGWGVAGTGTGLIPGFCATKRLLSARPPSARMDRVPSTVVFQGGASPQVITWLKCELLTIDRCDKGLIGESALAISQLDWFISGPDGAEALQSFGFSLRSNPKADRATLAIYSSEGMKQDLLIVYAGGEMDIDLMKQLVNDHRIEINTFSYFKDIRRLTPGVLIEGIQAGWITLAVSAEQFNGTRREIPLSDIRMLKQGVIFLLHRGGNVTMSDRLGPHDE